MILETIFSTHVFENPNSRLDKRQSPNFASNIKEI